MDRVHVPCPRSRNRHAVTAGPCECDPGCGLEGPLGRADRAGRRHVRGCPCRPCVGRRNRRKGQRKQSAARRLLGIEPVGRGADHEENWRGAVRCEVKAGRQVAGVWSRYVAMRAQSDAALVEGDVRPFVGVAMPDGVSVGVVLVRTDDVYRFARAVVDSMNQETEAG